MKSDMQKLAEDLAYQVLGDLDLDRIGREAAKDALRRTIAGYDFEGVLQGMVTDALARELNPLVVLDAVNAAIADIASDLVGGWLS